jgi:hypothetical protein
MVQPAVPTPRFLTQCMGTVFLTFHTLFQVTTQAHVRAALKTKVGWHAHSQPHHIRTHTTPVLRTRREAGVWVRASDASKLVGGHDQSRYFIHSSRSNLLHTHTTGQASHRVEGAAHTCTTSRVIFYRSTMGNQESLLPTNQARPQTRILTILPRSPPPQLAPLFAPAH